VTRRSFSHRVIFSALAVSMVVAVGTALFIYERYVKTVPKAATHLPDGAAFALRLDVEQVVTYEPFRKYILPVFERGRKGPEPRAKHLERKTTVELGIDSRELALAVYPDERWLIALGGVFRRDGVLSGAREMLADEGLESTLAEGVLCRGAGPCFGVAEDGTFVVGSTKTLTQEGAAPGRSGSYRDLLQADGTLAAIVVRPKKSDSPWVESLTGRRDSPGRMVLRGGKPFVAEGFGLGAPLSGVGDAQVSGIIAVMSAVSEGEHPGSSTKELSRPEFDSFVAGVGRLLESAIARKSEK